MDQLNPIREAKNRPLDRIGRQKTVRMADVVMKKVKNVKTEIKEEQEGESTEKENTLAPLPTKPRMRRKNSAPDISKLLNINPALASFTSFKKEKFRPLGGAVPRGRTGRRSTVHFSAGGLQLPVR